MNFASKGRSVGRHAQKIPRFSSVMDHEAAPSELHVKSVPTLACFKDSRRMIEIRHSLLPISLSSILALKFDAEHQ